MSRLFEALTRGQEVGPVKDLGVLLEGQAEGCAPPSEADPETIDIPVAPPDLAPGIRTTQLRVPLRGPVLPFDGSHWKAGEQYRILRTKIVQHLKMPQVVVITSPGPGDGKSVTAVNLAASLALKSDSRVLLIDADFRRSTIARQLGLATEPSLAEVLASERPFTDCLLRAQQVPNLYIMTAGATTVNPVELLDSARWRALIEFARVEFEYVVIDSPPIGAVADYELIQAVCDGAILVARPDHSDRQTCFRALDVIGRDKMLGVVLNCVTEWFLGNKNAYSGYFQYAAGTPENQPRHKV